MFIFCNNLFFLYFKPVIFRTHTGARPFLCRGCGKYYPLLETAQKHTRIFHGGDYSLIFYDISKDVNNPYVAKVIWNYIEITWMLSTIGRILHRDHSCSLLFFKAILNYFSTIFNYFNESEHIISSRHMYKLSLTVL